MQPKRAWVRISVGETYLWLIRLYVSTGLFQFPYRRLQVFSAYSGFLLLQKLNPSGLKKRVAPRKVARGLYWLSIILVKYIPFLFFLKKYLRVYTKASTITSIPSSSHWTSPKHLIESGMKVSSGLNIRSVIVPAVCQRHDHRPIIKCSPICRWHQSSRDQGQQLRSSGDIKSWSWNFKSMGWPMESLLHSW